MKLFASRTKYVKDIHIELNENEMRKYGGSNAEEKEMGFVLFLRQSLIIRRAMPVDVAGSRRMGKM